MISDEVPRGGGLGHPVVQWKAQLEMSSKALDTTTPAS
jgi:hypothetical protein